MPITSLALIAESLDSSQRDIIAQKLFAKLSSTNELDQEQKEAYSAAFSEIISLSTELKKKFFNEVVIYVQGLVSIGEDNHRSPIIKFCRLFREEGLFEKLLDLAIDKLLHYSVQNRRTFNDEIWTFAVQKYIEKKSDSSEDDSLNHKDCEKYLDFINYLFMNDDHIKALYSNNLLERIAILYTTSGDLSISHLALDILKWRISYICSHESILDFAYASIGKLLDISQKDFGSAAYTLWYWILDNVGVKNLQISESFQERTSKGSYWRYIRNGLSGISREQRKFSLVILEKTLASLSNDVDTPIFKWKMTEKTESLKRWYRFFTLYEIMGIDISMNQAEAAKNDLIKIVSPSSGIPVSFALTILAVGFRAPTVRIKSFALDLALSLPESSMGIFNVDHYFLTSTFLPFALMAGHFTVEKSFDGNYSCPYGEQFSDFISKCITSLQTEDNQVSFVNALLEVLGNYKMAYGPVRIYLLSGILKGLKSMKRSCLTGESLALITPLFEDGSGSVLWTKVLQTLQLRLLTYINCANVDDITIFSAIGHHAHFNGFEIYSENEELFIDLFSEQFRLSETLKHYQEVCHVGFELDALVAMSSYLLKRGVDASAIAESVLSYSQFDTFLFECGKSNLDFSTLLLEKNVSKRLGSIIGRMFQMSSAIESDLYAESGFILQNKDLFSYRFWEQVDLREMLQKLQNELLEVKDSSSAGKAVNRFKLFSHCVKECVYNENFTMEIESLLRLGSQAFEKIPKLANDRFVYHIKDEFLGLLMSTIARMIPACELDDQRKSAVLHFSSEMIDKSESLSHRGNIEMLMSLLDNYDSICKGDAKLIIQNLDSIWRDLTRDRLIMSERDMHHKFINLLTGSKLLELARGDDELSKTICDICESLLETSKTRKSLLTVLFDNISKLQLQDNDKFEGFPWIAKLLVKGAFLHQSTDGVFLVDYVLSELYDSEYNLSGVNLYNSIYGKPEVDYRIKLKAAIGSIRGHKLGESIWSYILENNAIFHLFKPVKRTDLVEQWKRIQLFQCMLQTLDVVRKDVLEKNVLEVVAPLLFTEPSPLCRIYIEWIIALTLHRYPELQSKVERLFENGLKHQKPMIIKLYERLIAVVILQMKPEEEAKCLERFLLDTVLPFSTSNRAVTRHFSTSMACFLYEEIQRKHLKISADILKTVGGIHALYMGLADAGKYKSGDAMLWNITGDLNLCGINGGVLLKVCDREVDAIFEKQWKRCLSPEQQEKLRILIGHDQKNLWVEHPRGSEVKLDTFSGVEEEDASNMLQIKSGTWSTVLDTDSQARSMTNIKRSPLIVMASLVDKPPNLGGICRLCDCLGAGWMTMDDFNVKSDKRFLSVAVTADRWMPMLEVKQPDIVTFLRMKKLEGYALIGLEQTDNSVELDSKLEFPEKSLIVLGKEREGIPAKILSELDFCVVIKQIGIVRSMNIQTATAVIVHAYSVQHC